MGKFSQANEEYHKRRKLDAEVHTRVLKRHDDPCWIPEYSENFDALMKLGQTLADNGYFLTMAAEPEGFWIGMRHGETVWSRGPIDREVLAEGVCRLILDSVKP